VFTLVDNEDYLFTVTKPIQFQTPFASCIQVDERFTIGYWNFERETSGEQLVNHEVLLLVRFCSTVPAWWYPVWCKEEKESFKPTMNLQSTDHVIKFFDSTSECMLLCCLLTWHPQHPKNLSVGLRRVLWLVLHDSCWKFITVITFFDKRFQTFCLGFERRRVCKKVQSKEDNRLTTLQRVNSYTPKHLQRIFLSYFSDRRRSRPKRLQSKWRWQLHLTPLRSIQRCKKAI